MEIVDPDLYLLYARLDHAERRQAAARERLAYQLVVPDKGTAAIRGWLNAAWSATIGKLIDADHLVRPAKRSLRARRGG
jgi:hypothetical protein